MPLTQEADKLLEKITEGQLALVQEINKAVSSEAPNFFVKYSAYIITILTGLVIVYNIVGDLHHKVDAIDIRYNTTCTAVKANTEYIQNSKVFRARMEPLIAEAQSHFKRSPTRYQDLDDRVTELYHYMELFHGKDLNLK